MTTQKINVVIDKDTDGFNGIYNYISADNLYKKDGLENKFLAYNEGGVKFLREGSQYYWVIPCNDFELIFNKTTNFTKYSGGFVAVTITRISEIKKSTAVGKKRKW